MLLENEVCRVEIYIDDTYTVDSADNKHYDLVLNPSRYKHSDICKTFAITVDICDDTYTMALTGGFHSYDIDCAILEENILLVLQENTVTKIDILNRSLILHKSFDCFSCNFGIYSVKNGYIIYGEIEITMLNRNMEKMWSFAGRDIFVTNSNKKPFTICEDTIELYDWEDNFYKIDFMGRLVAGGRTE